MKKKVLAFVLALAMVACLMPTAIAYDVRDAYDEFAATYPDFIENVVANGASESLIIDFLRALQRNLYNKNRNTPITEENFEEMLISAVKTVSNANRFASFQRAVILAYPDAVDAAYAGRIHEDFIPLYETVKTMIFDHHMLDSLDTDTSSDILTIVSVDALNGVTAVVGKDVELPLTVNGRTETGVAVPLSVSWTSVPPTTAEGVFYAEGSIASVPEGYKLDDSVSTAVTVEVTVKAESSTDPGTTGGDKDNNNNNNNNNNKDNNNGGGINGGTVDNTVNNNNNNIKHIYTFSDVDEKTEVGKAVYALSDIGIINGYLDGTFKADNPITRAEIAKIMVTALDGIDTTAAATFSDTKDHWALSYIATAQKMGLINGYPEGTFLPDNNITRAEVMTIVYRALDGKKAFTGSAAAPFKFSDDVLVPDYAKTPIGILANFGIIKGNTISQPDGTTLNNIEPEINATRGQCVLMVYNALKLIGKIK